MHPEHSFRRQFFRGLGISIEILHFFNSCDQAVKELLPPLLSAAGLFINEIKRSSKLKKKTNPLLWIRDMPQRNLMNYIFCPKLSWGAEEQQKLQKWVTVFSSATCLFFYLQFYNVSETTMVTASEDLGFTPRFSPGFANMGFFLLRYG